MPDAMQGFVVLHYEQVDIGALRGIHLNKNLSSKHRPCMAQYFTAEFLHGSPALSSVEALCIWKYTKVAVITGFRL